ncbi:MAG: hypothetical protein LBU23_11605 [Planctomycetota bacterium]|nr:hypothetical protein [Planctomycetota bacterium]
MPKAKAARRGRPSLFARLPAAISASAGQSRRWSAAVRRTFQLPTIFSSPASRSTQARSENGDNIFMIDIFVVQKPILSANPSPTKERKMPLMRRVYYHLVFQTIKIYLLT